MSNHSHRFSRCFKPLQAPVNVGEIFHCGETDYRGLKVEIFGMEGKQVVLRLGDEDAQPIFVSKTAASILADFFTLLSEVL